MLIRTAIRLASVRGRDRRLSILLFHRVLAEPDPLFPGEIDVEMFDRMLAWLGDWFQVLPLGEAIARLDDGSLPAGAAAITFDDGYADNRLHAAPLLSARGLHATLFVATGFLDGGRMWNDSIIESVRLARRKELDLESIGQGRLAVGGIADKRAALARLIPAVKHLPVQERLRQVGIICESAEAQLPDDLMMTSDQVREWHALGLGLGAHTVSHPILAKLDDESARREISTSREHLERLVGEPIRLFAFPNGKPGRDYSGQHALIAAELGYDAALSTHWGAATASCDRYQLPRFTPWDRTRTRFGLRMFSNLMKA